MIRTSLAGIRARVERLASAVPVDRACPVCVEARKRARVLHYFDGAAIAPEAAMSLQGCAGGRVSYDRITETCAACGRPFQIMRIVYEYMSAWPAEFERGVV